MTDEQKSILKDLIEKYDQYGFKRDIEFDYDKDNTIFEVCVCYLQDNGVGYIIHDHFKLKDLDFIRKHQITGKYELDLEIAYKQAFSNLYHKYGKIRPGLELVIVNNNEIYNTLEEGILSFRYEKELDSPGDNDYVDAKFNDRVNLLPVDDSLANDFIMSRFYSILNGVNYG